MKTPEEQRLSIVRDGMSSGTDEARQPHLCVVIPMYNAESHIAHVIVGMPDWVRTIVVVDDASTDSSLAEATQAADPRVEIARNATNQGVGGAMLHGYRRALASGADVMVKVDADGQMDPAFMAELVGPILAGNADYTKGNRFVHARQLEAMPLKRRIGNIGLSFLTKLASGYWNIFDPTNGYIAIHRSALLLLDEATIASRFFFESSMLLELGLQRAVVRDVYMPARYGSERSTLSEMRAGLEFPPRLLRGLLRRLWIQYYVRDFGLVAIFLTSGLGLATFGVSFGLWHWVQSARFNVPAPTGTVMLAVLPIILGVQFLLQALLLDVQNQPLRPLQRDLSGTPSSAAGEQDARPASFGRA
jgi:dolichol-phosphate mannosyltransferase